MTEIRAFKQETSVEILKAFTECVVNSFGNSFGAARELVIVGYGVGKRLNLFIKITEIFCKTLTVTRIFTTAYRHYSNRVTESYGTTISLSLLT